MSRTQRFRVQVGDAEHNVELSPAQASSSLSSSLSSSPSGASGVTRVSVDGVTHEVCPAPNGGWRVTQPGVRGQVLVATDDSPTPTSAAVDGIATTVVLQTAQQAALAEAMQTARGGSAGQGSVKSPMPGRIVKLLVEVGDTVEQGQAVIIVEAMKMENEVEAAGDGVVSAIHVAAGDTVDSGAILVEVSPHEEPS